MCCSLWIKKPLWECLEKKSLSFPTLHLQGLGSVELQGVQEHNTARTQVLLRQQNFQPPFPFLSRAYEHERWHLTSHALGHFSAMTDDWGLAALSMMCSMAQRCLSHRWLSHSLHTQTPTPEGNSSFPPKIPCHVLSSVPHTGRLNSYVLSACWKAAPFQDWEKQRWFICKGSLCSFHHIYFFSQDGKYLNHK